MIVQNSLAHDQVMIAPPDFCGVLADLGRSSGKPVD
jgi:hypothetical protein